MKPKNFSYDFNEKLDWLIEQSLNIHSQADLAKNMDSNDSGRKNMGIGRNAVHVWAQGTAIPYNRAVHLCELLMTDFEFLEEEDWEKALAMINKPGKLWDQIQTFAISSDALQVLRLDVDSKKISDSPTPSGSVVSANAPEKVSMRMKYEPPEASPDLPCYKAGERTRVQLNGPKGWSALLLLQNAEKAIRCLNPVQQQYASLDETGALVMPTDGGIYRLSTPAGEHTLIGCLKPTPWHAEISSRLDSTLSNNIGLVLRHLVKKIEEEPCQVMCHQFRVI